MHRKDPCVDRRADKLAAQQLTEFLAAISAADDERGRDPRRGRARDRGVRRRRRRDPRRPTACSRPGSAGRSRPRNRRVGAARATAFGRPASANARRCRPRSTTSACGRSCSPGATSPLLLRGAQSRPRHGAGAGDDRRACSAWSTPSAGCGSSATNQARENERLVESLAERQRLLERLSKIQRSIVSRRDLDEVLDAIVAGAMDLLGDETVGLRLLDPEDPELAAPRRVGGHEARPRGPRCTAARSATARAVRPPRRAS